jgi:YaiO family outer membrane protein
VRGQTQRKFDRTESRGGGGAEWRASRNAILRGGGVFSSGAIVYPRADATLDLDVYHRSLTWFVSGRYLHFSDSDVGIGSIGLAWSASDDTTLTFRYYRSQTAFATTDEDAGNNAGSTQLSQRVSRRVRLYVGYAYGYESFENVTAETLTQRGAHTLSAGALIACGPRLAISPAVEIQQRNDESRVTSAALTLVHRF